MSDGLPHSHEMEPPVRHPRPHIGQGLATAQRGTKEIVPVVPIAEITATGHIEHAAHAHTRSKGLGVRDVTGTIEREHTSVDELLATARGVGPEIALTIHEGSK